MKILKILLIVLLSIFLLIVVVGYLQPSTVQVKVERVLKAPTCVVFDHVNDLEKRVLWSPWSTQDTTMQITWGEKRKGLGASYSWQSQSMGNGTLIYIESDENKKVVSDLNFGEQGKGVASITLSEAEDGVLVSWELVSEIGDNPFNRLFGIFIKVAVEQSFILGLNQLEDAAKLDQENPCLTPVVDELIETSIDSTIADTLIVE